MRNVRASTYAVEVFYEWTAATATTVTGVGVSAYATEVFVVQPEHPLMIPAYAVEVFYETAQDEHEDPGTGGGGTTDGVRVFGYAG